MYMFLALWDGGSNELIFIFFLTIASNRANQAT